MSTSPGFYKMHRGWMENPVFGREPFTRAQAWIWLIEHAAWRDTTQAVGRHFVHVERGQLAVAVRYLAEAWQWSKSSVDRFLTRLETGTMIGTQPGTQYTVITICNYKKYQGDWDTSGTQDGTALGTRVGHDRDKEEEGKKIRKTLLPDTDAADSKKHDDDAFSRFWSAYPRKQAKADALKAWKTSVKKSDPDTITAAAEQYARECSEKQTASEYIKLAGGWLRAERWNDFQQVEEPPLLVAIAAAPIQPTDDDETWKARAKRYHDPARGGWSAAWGPDLLSRDCRVPPHLLCLFHEATSGETL